jgi:hypothetical protein
MSKPEKNRREETPAPAAKPSVVSLARPGFVPISMSQLGLSTEEQETLAGGACIQHSTDTQADEQTPTSDDPPTTASIRQEVATLTFAYADREAAWLNRYNKDDKTLEWAFKESFYQKRFQELLVLLSDDAVERLHLIISRKLTYLPGESTRNRSTEDSLKLIKRLGHAIEDTDTPTKP